MRKLPDTNNCYGQIWSGNIGDVCNAALKSGPWTVTRCDRSQFDGHWRLHLEVADVLELESDGPLDDGSYLLNGGVATDHDRGHQLLSELSRCLTAAGIPHRFEMLDTSGEIVRPYHHLWPDNKVQLDVPLWQC